MISDVLSDALAQIRDYRSDPVFRGIYADMSAELDALESMMQSILQRLDTPASAIETQIDDGRVRS